MNRQDRAGQIGAAARTDYRAVVVANTGGDPGWRNPAWLDHATCTRPDAADPVLVDDCRACPVRWACLTAALVLDDPTPIRAGFTGPARRALFGLLEVDATADEPWLLGHPGRHIRAAA